MKGCNMDTRLPPGRPFYIPRGVQAYFVLWYTRLFLVHESWCLAKWQYTLRISSVSIHQPLFYRPLSQHISLLSLPPFFHSHGQNAAFLLPHAWSNKVKGKINSLKRFTNDCLIKQTRVFKLIILLALNLVIKREQASLMSMFMFPRRQWKQSLKFIPGLSMKRLKVSRGAC